MVKRKAADGVVMDPLNKPRVIKTAMHAVSANVVETNSGRGFLDELGAAPSAATAFSIIAAIRKGAATTPDKVRRRLPEAWAASAAPAGASMADVLQRLKDEAVELTENEVLSDMRKLQNEAGGADDDEHRRRTRRNSINQRLARLTRGTANAGVHLLETAEGDAAADARAIAEHLAARWAAVFRDKPVGEAKLNS